MFPICSLFAIGIFLHARWRADYVIEFTLVLNKDGPEREMQHESQGN